MPKDFGDILDQWDSMTGKSYGKKRIKKDNKKIKNIIEKDNTKKINPMEAGLRRYGVFDKDAANEKKQLH